MKNWLIRFRLSNSLDSARPLPRALRRAVVRSSETARFAKALRRLDMSLRDSGAGEMAPPDMTGSIMRAVRQRALTPISRRPRHWMPVASAGLAAAACVLALSLSRPTPPARPLPAAAPVRTDPGASAAPLRQEWQDIHRDAAAARDTLFASLP